MNDDEMVIHNGVKMCKANIEHIKKAQFSTYIINGEEYPRVIFGDETPGWFGQTEPCHDCGILKGQYHVPGCDVEQCSGCLCQSIDCYCEDEDDE